jgi:hypothetical protein
MRLFSTPEFEALLLDAGRFTWAAGPLTKGSDLCHGTSGNGYAFLKLYRRTNDPMWLDRARQFAMTAIIQYRGAKLVVSRGGFPFDRRRRSCDLPLRLHHREASIPNDRRVLTRTRLLSSATSSDRADFCVGSRSDEICG